MKIAIWSEPSGAWLAQAYQLKGHTVLRMPSYEVKQALAQGEVAAGLIPLMTVLREPDGFAASAKVGLVVEEYPFVQLRIRDGLDQVKKVAFDPRYQQEVLIARIVLKEHYDQSPQFVPIDSLSMEKALEKADSVLWIGDGLADETILTLDLGQEWMDYTIYPTPWGVMAMRRDTVTDESMRELEAILQDTYPLIRPQNEAQEAFYETSFSPKWDDFAFAGLTATCENLFFHQALDEIPEFPFYVVKEDEPEEEEEV